MGRGTSIGVAMAATAAFLSTAAGAQTAPAADADSARPDAMAQAYLLGAGFKTSDLSQDKAGGMMFVPGRGLVRWDTQGKTPQEQEALRAQAIAQADARSLQAAISAQTAAADAEGLARRGQAFPADALHPARGPADAPMIGGYPRAGVAVPLNTAARAAYAAGGPAVPSGARFGDQNRLYMFGAVSGRAVGLNLLHDTGAGWRGGGLSTDTGGFSGRRQAGLALRQGSTQTSLSVLQEKTHSEIVGLTTIKDRRAMITFSYRPPPPPAAVPPPK